jgi:hypothetical protein
MFAGFPPQRTFTQGACYGVLRLPLHSRSCAFLCIPGPSDRQIPLALLGYDKSANSFGRIGSRPTPGALLVTRRVTLRDYQGTSILEDNPDYQASRSALSKMPLRVHLFFWLLPKRHDIARAQQGLLAGLSSPVTRLINPRSEGANPSSPRLKPGSGEIQTD